MAETRRINATPVTAVQGTLALEILPRREPPHSTPGARGDVVGINAAREREVEAWVRRFAQAAAEIVGGDRPASQLSRWCSTAVHRDLERRAQLVAAAGRHTPGIGRVQPVRPRVASVRSCFIDPGVVEVAIRMVYGARSRALAARFERRQERWLCTALQWG